MIGAGAAVGIAQSAFNAFMSEMAANSQYERQLDFWNKQNAYNHPMHQRNRMLQAGMNPVGAVESQPAGELSTVPANEFLKNGMFNILPAIETLSQAEKTGAETDLLSQQILLAELERQLKEGQILGQQLSNEEAAILLEYIRTEKELTMAKVQAEIDRVLAERDKIVQDTATSATTADLNTATAEALRTKLPHEVDSLVAGTELKRAQTATEQYKRDYYTASSANERSMAVKNYAEARLINVKADIDEAYGALQAQATLTKTQLESQVIVPLADSLIALQESMEMLNRDTVRHNKALEDIQREANRIQEALVKIKQYELHYSIVKDTVDRMMPDVNKLLGAIAGIVG